MVASLMSFRKNQDNRPNFLIACIQVASEAGFQVKT
jgi:hypothetical protein